MRPAWSSQVVNPEQGRCRVALAGINLLDTATHRWDLAIATVSPAALPADVAETASKESNDRAPPELRQGRFGPEVAAPDGSRPDHPVRRVPRADAE